MKFDRVRCGHPTTGIVEVFDPPWWRLDRWFLWFFCSRRYARGKVSIVVSGTEYVVRCRSLEPVKPRQLMH